jgi:glycerophosphoryl diester phosphodiesterase
LENTREGFEMCAKMGIDAVELDVFLLKCGSLIVFHGGGTDENPGDLLDYCGVKGNILDLTYKDALKLSFNPSYAEFGCCDEITLRGSIPTLEQVLLDAKKSGIHIKIELKGEGTVEPTLEVVERLNIVNQCSFSSFDLDRLAYLRNLRPQRDTYITGAIFDERPGNFIQQAERVGATEIHLRYDTCTTDAVSSIHEAGFGSMCWFRGPIGMALDCREKYLDVGNEDETMYDIMLTTGVQQLCINRPDILLGLKHRLNLPRTEV